MLFRTLFLFTTVGVYTIWFNLTYLVKSIITLLYNDVIILFTKYNINVLQRMILITDHVSRLREGVGLNYATEKQSR